MIKFENKVNGRFYYLQVKRDIFDDLVIHITRGGRHVSHVSLVFCDNDRSVRDKIRQITQRRLARGYTLIQ